MPSSPSRLFPTDALRLVVSKIQPLPAIEVPLDQAYQKICREVVFSDAFYPPFDRVCMDGIAVDYSGKNNQWNIQGLQAAGQEPLQLLSEQCAIEVNTGTTLPKGCNTVIPVEHLHYNEGKAFLKEGSLITVGQHIQKTGEDYQPGMPLINPFWYLRGGEIATAAAIGKSKIAVSPMPQIHILSTGSELVPITQAPLPHQIRQSNLYALEALLEGMEFHCAHKQHIHDDPQEIEKAVRQSLESCNVLVLSGGVSAGKLDYVPDVLDKCGVQKVFHKVEQKPGKPLWFGRTAKDQLIFGLPGNPVSAMICLGRYVIPALFALQGRPYQHRYARLETTFNSKPGLPHFLPVQIRYGEDGSVWAKPRLGKGSGDFASLCSTHGFLELPAGPVQCLEGASLPFYPWFLG